jgi:hypothetical protein
MWPVSKRDVLEFKLFLHCTNFEFTLSPLLHHFYLSISIATPLNGVKINVVFIYKNNVLEIT